MSGYTPPRDVTVPPHVRACLRGKPMNYRPIGLSHSKECDNALTAGDYDRLCDECRMEADRDWTIPEGADQ